MHEMIQLRQLLEPQEMGSQNSQYQSNIMSRDTKKDNNSKYLLTLLHINAQVKVFHWQTDSYAQHEAFGNYYEVMDELTDTFVESYQGKYCRIDLEGEECFNISLKGFHIAHLEVFLNEVCDFLCEMLPSTFSENDSELFNLVDEMVSETNKLKYLLTLR
jgi:hypothetical protein